MNTLKSVGVSAIVALIIVLGLMYLRPAPVAVPLGAVSGPDSFNPRECKNGVCTNYYKSSLTTATTTVCSFQGPNATSSIENFGIRFTTGSTTAKTIILAKGAAQQASTTVLGSFTLGANADGEFTASSTQDDMVTNLLAPSNWLNVSMVGGAGVDSPVGSCQAVLTEL